MFSQKSQTLEVVARILLRCSILGAVLLFFWFGVLLFAGDLVYMIHGGLFNLDIQELRIIHYCGMMATKLCVGMFFFIPWIAIRMELSRRQT